MIGNTCSGAGCAAAWCRTARSAAAWLLLAGSAGAIEPSGSNAPNPNNPDPFVKLGAPIGSARPVTVATPSKDSAGVAQLSPIATPYVPYHATATSPWSPRAVDPPPADAFAAPRTEAATPGSVFESLFDPNKLVPVVFPETPAAPQAATGDEPARAVAPSPGSTDAGVFAPPVVDTGRMTPVTFGPAKTEKPATPVSPLKKKAAAKPLDDVDDNRSSVEPAAAKPAEAKPAGVRPPVAAKYHLPQPPIPLP
jgi:hypothetical protein